MARMHPVIPTLDLSGTPAQVGAAHGEAQRERIREYADRFLGWLLRSTAVSLTEEGLWARWAPQVAANQREAPELVEEMRGIARGSGVPFERIRRTTGFHFVDHVSRDARVLADIESLTAGGYTVRTTINPALQQATEAAFQEGLARYELSIGRQRYQGAEANLAGAVKALEGTKDRHDVAGLIANVRRFGVFEESATQALEDAACGHERWQGADFSGATSRGATHGIGEYADRGAHVDRARGGMRTEGP